MPTLEKIVESMRKDMAAEAEKKKSESYLRQQRGMVGMQPPVVQVPGVLNAQRLRYSEFEKIRDLLVAFSQTDMACTPENTSLAAGLLVADVHSKLGEDATAAQVACMDQSAFATVQRLMEQYPGTSASITTPEAAEREVLAMNVIELAMRDHEDEYLWEAVSQQRPCVYGERCINYLRRGYILREFLTEREQKEVEITNCLNALHKPCLRCIRYTCGLAYHYQTTCNIPFTPRYNSQPHRVAVDIPGEYLLNDCLPVGLQFLYPMVRDEEEKYQDVTRNSVRGLRQLYGTTPVAHPQRGF